MSGFRSIDAKGQTWKIGDTGFEVEWTQKPEGPYPEDFDPDDCTTRRKNFRTRAEAIQFARTAVDSDLWGCPVVTPFRFIEDDPGAKVKAYGDSEGPEEWDRPGLS